MVLCPKCGLDKPESSFYKSSIRKNGLTCHCKDCQIEYRIAHADRYREQKHKKYLEHREQRIQEAREYRKENKDLIKQRWDERYLRDKDILIQRSQEYYYNNKDKVLKRIREYSEKNRDKILERIKIYQKTPQARAVQARSRHRRYSREKESECTLTDQQWQTILQEQNNKCAICGKPFNKSRYPTRDHIVPLSLGGGLTFENVQALCHTCNSSKRDVLDYSNIRTWLSEVVG